MLPSINGIMSPLHNVVIQSRHQANQAAKRKRLSPDQYNKHQHYRTVKPNSYSFSDPPGDKSFSVNRISVRQVKRSFDLSETINDQQLNEAKRRILELEMAAEAMTLRLQDMQEVNKRLLNDKLASTAGESQTMFQQLLLTDLNGVVDNLKFEYGTLREQNEELRKRLDIANKEKKSLALKVRRYKQLLAEKANTTHDVWLNGMNTSDALGHRSSIMSDKFTPSRSEIGYSIVKSR